MYVPADWMPSESPPHIHHLQGHVQLMAASCHILELEVRRVEATRKNVAAKEGGALARKQVIKHLYSQGLEARAKAQEIKLERFLELAQSKMAPMRWQPEA